jgi:hypothetical protein
MVVLLPAYKNKDAKGDGSDDSQHLRDENQSLRDQVDDLQERLSAATRDQQRPEPQQQRQTEEPFIMFNGFPLGNARPFVKCGLSSNPTSALSGSDSKYRQGQSLAVIGQNSFYIARPRPAQYVFLCTLEGGPPQVSLLVETFWNRGGFRENRLNLSLGQEVAVSGVQVDANGNIRPLN